MQLRSPLTNTAAVKQAEYVRSLFGASPTLSVPVSNVVTCANIFSTAKFPARFLRRYFALCKKHVLRGLTACCGSHAECGICTPLVAQESSRTSHQQIKEADWPDLHTKIAPFMFPKTVDTGLVLRLYRWFFPTTNSSPLPRCSHSM